MKKGFVTNMDISLILKVAGIGIIVAITHQLLSKAGREDQAMLVSVTGAVIVLLLLVDKIGELIDSIRGIFGL